MSASQIDIRRIDADLTVEELCSQPTWGTPSAVIDKYWSGKRSPKGRHSDVWMFWSQTALYLRFDSVQCEPLIVNDEPDTSQKTVGLWEGDVCEAFISTDAINRERYYEFEVAPTGEWVDLQIRCLAGVRETDIGYVSGMQAAARIEEGSVVSAMKIEWDAFGKIPGLGERWAGNLFRCVGSGETRGYLAWRPTFTPVPNFHVPEQFGELVFCKEGGPWTFT